VLIRRLRDLELSLDEVKRLLAYGDSPALPAALQTHRRRLEARLTRLRRQLHDLDHLMLDGRNVMAPRTDPGLDAATHREVAVALFNRAWSLLETEGRSQEQDDELIHVAHASAYHWMQVGTAVNRARSEWQCSRAYAVLGRSEPALWHAQRSLAICQGHDIRDFDLGFAFESLARAHAVAGDQAEASRWLEQARNAAAEVAEDDDRELLLTDLETIPNLWA
jgi:DNA-binding transcriptional MerR regulator